MRIDLMAGGVIIHSYIINDSEISDLIKGFNLLDRLNRKKLKKQSISADCCSICLHPCGKNNNYKLKCGCKLSYHKKCINGWLDKKNSCPICKK